MKLFQQMLVAPAALVLLAPIAVINSPAANAAELNINGVTVGSYFSSWRNASLLVDILFTGGLSLDHKPSLATNVEIIVFTANSLIVQNKSTFYGYSK